MLINEMKFLENFNALPSQESIHEDRKKLFRIIMEDCETYSDAEKLADQGVITLENIMDLLTHFDDVSGLHENELVNLFKFANALKASPNVVHEKRHRLL